MPGFNRIIPQYSTSSLAVPTASGMLTGELAVNVIDGRIYTMDQNSNIVLIGGSAITASFANMAGAIDFVPLTASYSNTASVLATNNVIQWTAISLATQAQWTSSVPLPNRSIVYSVSGSAYSRIRLYNTSGSQNSDLSRNTASFASASSGLLLDVVMSGSNLITYLSPPASCYGGSLFPTASVAMTVTNLTNATVALSGSITYMSL